MTFGFDLLSTIRKSEREFARAENILTKVGKCSGGVEGEREIVFMANVLQLLTLILAQKVITAGGQEHGHYGDAKEHAESQDTCGSATIGRTAAEFWHLHGKYG